MVVITTTLREEKRKNNHNNHDDDKLHPENVLVDDAPGENEANDDDARVFFFE